MNRTVLCGIVCLVAYFTLQTSVVAAAQGSLQEPGAEGANTTKSGGTGGARSPALTGERRPFYRLQKSDIIEVNFTFSPEFNQTLTIGPDGFITPRGVPALYVEGTPLPQLSESLKRAYSEILHDPEITLALKEFEKPYFVATGEVTRPGKYELHGDTTVTEALAMSGGFNGQAKHSQVILFRRVSDGVTEAKLLNVKQMMNSRDLREDSHLKTGDLLFVPQNRISKLRRYLPTSALGMYWNAAAQF